MSAEDSAKFGVTSYPIEQLWPLADYITVHVPLIPPTKSMFDLTIPQVVTLLSAATLDR